MPVTACTRKNVLSGSNDANVSTDKKKSYIELYFILFQTLDFDRDGLTKLKKAIKAIHNSGNGEYI